MLNCRGGKTKHTVALEPQGWWRDRNPLGTGEVEKRLIEGAVGSNLEAGRKWVETKECWLACHILNPSQLVRRQLFLRFIPLSAWRRAKFIPLKSLLSSPALLKKKKRGSNYMGIKYFLTFKKYKHRIGELRDTLSLFSEYFHNTSALNTISHAQEQMSKFWGAVLLFTITCLYILTTLLFSLLTEIILVLNSSQNLSDRQSCQVSLPKSRIRNLVTVSHGVW